MVLATAGEADVQAGKARASTKSRASRASRASRRSKPRSWYCCPCPLTAALRRDGESGRCGRSGGHEHRDDEEGVPGVPGVPGVRPAKFYCCRADLVAAMARERALKTEPVDDDDSLDEVAEEALPDDTFWEVFERSHQQDLDERWLVQEPDLPYVENLPQQLDVGRAIVVQGAVLPDAVGFALNLSCGAGDAPDIALHLNPRLDMRYVARNSRMRGAWGREEGAALGGSPFRRGQQFVIHVFVTATDFKVSVDSMHFCSFQYRMPLSKICRLEIHGDVIVSSIQHTRLEVYPERPLDALPEHTFCTIPTDHVVPWSLDIPMKENLFIGRFKPNLSPGLEVTIRGRMKLLPQSFYINLQQGCQLWPHPNVHFHLNPRFASEDSEHVVVVNGWIRGSWGTEQRYSRCRFKPGEPFTIVIYIEDQRYRVMVDDLQQAAMFHRAPPSLVDTLVVRGDVFINHIGIGKSNLPVERLPSPESPSESLKGSFVHIPQLTSSPPDLNLCSQSQESESKPVSHLLKPDPSILKGQSLTKNRVSLSSSPLLGSRESGFTEENDLENLDPSEFSQSVKDVPSDEKTMSVVETASEQDTHTSGASKSNTTASMQEDRKEN